jgi:hypothetical protein
LRTAIVRIAFRGDSEQLILDLIDRLDDPTEVAGLTWMKDGSLAHNANPVLERDLDCSGSAEIGPRPIVN